MHARCLDFLERTRLTQLHRDADASGLGIGGKSAGAVNEIGLARIGQRHELAGFRAADLAGIGLDHAILEAKALADACIGDFHIAIGLVERLLVGIEAVGVLHHELAGPEQTEARPHLVAELHLHLP